MSVFVAAAQFLMAQTSLEFFVLHRISLARKIVRVVI